LATVAENLLSNNPGFDVNSASTLHQQPTASMFSHKAV
jgi:hypothetical protein